MVSIEHANYDSQKSTNFSISFLRQSPVVIAQTEMNVQPLNLVRIDQCSSVLGLLHVHFCPLLAEFLGLLFHSFCEGGFFGNGLFGGVSAHVFRDLHGAKMRAAH